ncbi:MAG: hypothetical protein JW925_04105 [Syntrophaceae bacterium]|nr:hypothetical protein [Syntrophaceae bacterium]
MKDLKEISKQYSPTDFMRARRPELYSDTTVIEEPVLNRNQLEFHLDTLTQRKEEIRFEHFCRRLAEKELCPNLLPQTGPTGGGDSKVDTETYPVAKSISERWYEGDPERSSQERWAFAISAKKKWRPKVKTDIQKIVETNRNYSLIYFITNQAVRDRDRATVEDELRELWGIDVRILDRSWIIEMVTKNNRWEIVYQTLDIDRQLTKSKPSLGPLDAERQRNLEELDKMIEDQERYHSSKYQLAEDCLQSALIARGLGRPRMEVDGRFDRAERIARERDDNRQLVRILYQKAWTANWWFDDFGEIERIYKIVEPLVISSAWIWDLEKLVNLWQIRTTWRQFHKTLIEEKIWATHTSKLRTALSRHASNSGKATSALWARTELALMDLTDAAISKADLAPILRNIQQILKESQGHPEYPFEPIIQIAKELNRIVGGDSAYDEFFEAIIQFQSIRAGRSEEGRMRLERGYQKLGAEKTYDAIDQFAKAQTLLAQNEYKNEFVQAVVGTALGYERAGLLWAARANLIAALDRTLYEYFKDGQIVPQSLPLIRKLVWTEIQLGRVLCALAWIELLQIISKAIELPEIIRKNTEEEFQLMDVILGILILRTRYSDWLHLDRIAGLMERYSLLMSRSAVLFSLGYEDAVRFECGQQNEDLDHFFSLWTEQPAADDLPFQAEWHIGKSVILQSVLLGCKIELVVKNNLDSILLGEAILSFLESFLSTSIKLKQYSVARSYLKIEVQKTNNITHPITHKIEEDECGESWIIVMHSSESCSDIVQKSEYQEALFKLLAEVIMQLQIPFSSASIKKLFTEHRAQDRAFFVAQSPLAVTNILSDKPKYNIHDWIDESFSESFTLVRTEPWVAKIDSDSDVNVTEKKFSFADGQPPPELFGVDGLKHSDFQVLSPINLTLWDKAKWSGLGFIIIPGYPPPGLILLFKDIDAGKKIFRGWRKRLGNVDVDEWIGVTLITGIDRQNPSHYRVAIGVNETYLTQSMQHKDRLTMVYRMKDMTPVDDTNLKRFIEQYKRAGRYLIGPGLMKDDQSIIPYVEDLYIEKVQIRNVSAWQIGPSDPIIAALGGIENPYIPPNINDAPILKALERVKVYDNYYD